MLKYTFSEALKLNSWPRYKYCVYVYRHDETNEVLYVGQTDSPFVRLRAHSSASSKLKIGVFIRDNMPQSLNWQVEIYGLSECDSFVWMYKRDDYTAFQECQKEHPLMHNSAQIAERALIAHFMPPYNFALKPKNSLPRLPKWPKEYKRYFSPD